MIDRNNFLPSRSPPPSVLKVDKKFAICIFLYNFSEKLPALKKFLGIPPTVLSQNGCNTSNLDH